MTRSLRRLLPIGLAALVAVAARPAAAADDAKARALLEAVAKTYQGLPSYSDQGQFSVAFAVNGQAQKRDNPMSVAFARPNKVDLNLGGVRITSDGKTQTTTITPLRKYVQEPAPEAIKFDTFRQGATGSLVFGGPNGLTVGLVLALLTADDPVKEILDGTEGLKLEEDREVDGKTVTPILVDQSQGPDLRLLVDKKTNLLAGIDLVIGAEELAQGVPKGTKIEVQKFGWSANGAKAGALKEDAFAFEPPKGFEKVESLAAAFGQPAGGAQEEPASALVGKAAPDFTMTAIDGDKLVPLKKADLAGKVVMIDFWATWCGPCLRELPEVQEMVKDLARAKKEVRVIALSVDENPGSDAEMRKLVEATLEEKEISLGGNAVGTVALDTKGEIARDYQANAIPMIVLLDREGVVQQVHIGSTERSVLEEEINTLLAGKPLAKPKAAEAKAEAKD